MSQRLKLGCHSDRRAPNLCPVRSSIILGPVDYLQHPVFCQSARFPYHFSQKGVLIQSSHQTNTRSRCNGLLALLPESFQSRGLMGSECICEPCLRLRCLLNSPALGHNPASHPLSRHCCGYNQCSSPCNVNRLPWLGRSLRRALASEMKPTCISRSGISVFSLYLSCTVTLAFFCSLQK